MYNLMYLRKVYEVVVFIFINCVPKNRTISKCSFTVVSIMVLYNMGRLEGRGRVGTRSKRGIK